MRGYMLPLVLTTAVLVPAGALVAQEGRPGGNNDREKPPMTAERANSPLDFTVKDIDGRTVELSRYKGDVLLIVNVASRCGYTPQYEQLQAVHERFREQGLRVLAFPCNDFGRQEPGTNEEIKDFCLTKYSVSFDLFDKVRIKGDDASELYKFLTSREKVGDHAGEIKWNFTKFLVDRRGRVVNRFESKVKPDAKEVIDRIEELLKAER